MTCVLVALLAACKTAHAPSNEAAASAGSTADSGSQPAKAAAPSPKEVPAAALEDVAGTSVEAAVSVPAEAPNGGIDFENNWIFDRYGRFRRHAGGTGTLNGRRYDVITIELPNGDTKKIYFDITENWAHWSPPSH